MSVEKRKQPVLTNRARSTREGLRLLPTRLPPPALLSPANAHKHTHTRPCQQEGDGQRFAVAQESWVRFTERARCKLGEHEVQILLSGSLVLFLLMLSLTPHTPPPQPPTPTHGVQVVAKVELQH